MRTLLLALLIVLLGIGTSVATFLWGGKVARARIQNAMTQILEASQAAKAIKSPEQDILQDPPDVQPAGNERQTELSLAALEAMRETAEPGSLRFDNPDVVNLLNQFAVGRSTRTAGKNASRSWKSGSASRCRISTWPPSGFPKPASPRTPC